MKKQYLTNSKGVTLVALIITIVVLIIIASIATYSGIDIIRSSRLTSFTTEMKIMQTEVNELYEQWKNGEIIIDDNGNVTIQEDESTQVSIGKDLTYDSDVENQASYVLIHQLDLGDTLSDLKAYRYFDYATIEYLGIEGTEGEFFVNIADRKVVSFEGFRYEGVMYYTLEQLSQSLYNVDYNPNQGEPTFDVSFEKIGEEKYRITISNIQYDGNIDKWYVKYQEDGADYWNTSEDLSFVVNKKVNYKIYIENGKVKSAEKPVEIVAEEFNRAYGEIDVVFLSGKTDNVSSSANVPVLGANMTPVNFNSSNNTWQEVDESNWEYSYIDTPKESKWANAVVKDDSGNITGYFVWIPRYAYKITYYNEPEHQTIIGYSDARGMVTANGAEYIGQGSRRKAGDNYVVHPTFTNDIEVGGWDSELEGIWVAKYEASSSNPSASTGGGNTTDLDVKVLPGITIWRDIQIGNMYTVSRNYSPENNSHLMKNSEWGALAYLSYSNYGIGRETIVAQNTNSITGGSSKESEIYTTNVGQSTTGNAWGIYDINGIYEYVASYVNNGYSQLTSNGQILIDAGTSEENNEKRTVQVYEASNGGNGTVDNDAINYKLSGEKMFGDAIYESSTGYADSTGSWQDAYASIPYGEYPFFIRGYMYRTYSAMFSFYYASGANEAYCSFRPVLAF